MDFQLDSNQKLIREMIHDFAEKELREKAMEIDRTGEFPWDSVRKMAQLGIMGFIVPTKYGGAEASFVSLAIAIEEISRVCASTGVIVAVNNTLASYPILAFGNEDQKKKYLPQLSNATKLGAIGLTEANAGSDVASMETTARLEGDHYVLNGSKRFITNGGEAGIFVVFAYTDKSLKHKGISAFIVEKDFPGFSVGKHEDLLGIRATSNCELIFDDCIVSKENLLGGEGQGFKVAMNTLDVSRIDIGAQAVGVSQGAFEAAVQYAKERKAFGQVIGQFQMIQDKLAEMATRIDASRLLVYRAAALKDQGLPRFTKEAAMAKYYAAETATYVAKEAVQIFGGYGYSKDYEVERYYRDAKVMEIYEGTSEIQKVVIARNLLS